MMTVYLPTLRITPERALRATLNFKPAGAPRTDAVVAPPSTGILTVHGRRAWQVAARTFAKGFEPAGSVAFNEDCSPVDPPGSADDPFDCVVSVTCAEGDRALFDDGAGGATDAFVAVVGVGTDIPAADGRASAAEVDGCAPPTGEFGSVVVAYGVVAALVEVAGTVVAGRVAIAPEIDVRT
jgi:hypothetical protein